jgi:pyruvate/2-oxoglutarate dehydrogenase complex dihydrolipoamide dehydrogenase (E3) component
VSRKFDAIIVGAGQAGPSLAGRLTAAGMNIAVIERKLFGGTCVNTGCIPTKTLVASAYAAHMARRGGDFGVVPAGPVAVDMKKVKARKDAVSGKSRRGVETGLDGMERCTAFRGHARFESPRTMSVNGETLEAERIFLNLGGRALVPEISTRCRGIWRSSAAAISGSSSRRCIAASAPR